jgi:SNF2 family DNA or RNA helicase
MITTATVITQMMRLHQITCGHFKSDDGTIQTIKNNRIDQLMEVLEEMEGKAVIWAHYRYDIKNIVETVSKKYGENSVVTYYGDTSTDDRQKAIKKIQDPKSPVRFIVGTPQTGGYGITLTGAIYNDLLF